jgi:hypothetical protein
VTVRLLPWRPSPAGGALGRHVEHDERSRSFAVGQAAPIRSVLHRRHVPIYDQGSTGSCTGNALAGALSSGPFRHRFTEPTARRVYSAATRLDDVDGHWPPDDTGSSGLAVCKVAKAKGWISRYEHAFSLDQALAALSNGPVLVGITWLEGCDSPGPSGLVRYAGDVRGGHEVCAVGIDSTGQTVRFANSWGSGWGDHGYFQMTWDDLRAALADSGDVTVPIR